LDCLLVATSAVSGFQLFDVLKIKRVEIWGLLAVGTPSTVEVQFPASSGDASIHTDTSLGIKPAFVNAKPSIRSLSSFYAPSTGTVAISLTCPAGSIIDISLVYKSSSQNPIAVTNALVAAVTGEFYWRGLDGLPIASTNFPPPTGVQTR